MVKTRPEHQQKFRNACFAAKTGRKHIRMRMETLWKLVRAWAAANGYEHHPTYGIVGVAPT